MKREGYVCDAGCGADLVIETSDSLFRHGWLTTYTPGSLPTWHTCSVECLAVVVNRAVDGPARLESGT